MLDSVFEKYEHLVVLDTETTGIDCKSCEIIELAALCIDRSGNREEMDDLIRLSEGTTLPQEIVELTHITPEMLERDGVSKRESAERFAEMIRKPNTMIAAFNAQFDFTFLFYFLAREGLQDTLKNLGMLDVMTIYKDRRPYPHRLFNAIESYGVSAQNTHRAIDDADAALLVLDAMAREKDDVMQYENLFGFNPKYGVSGPRIGSIHYAPQKFDPACPLYALYAPV